MFSVDFECVFVIKNFPHGKKELVQINQCVFKVDFEGYFGGTLLQIVAGIGAK